jgi:hypothetical protein
MDDDSHSEAEIIQFPDEKAMGGQMTQAIYEITLREEFDKLNELTGTITFISGKQGGSGKSIADSLEGVII